MKGLRINREGHNVFGYRIQLAHTAGYGGEVAPRKAASTAAASPTFRGFDIRAQHALCLRAKPHQLSISPTRMGSLVPRDPTNSALGTIQIPLPVYRLVQIGGDTQFTTNMEYRIPIVQPGHLRLLHRLSG